MRYDASSSAIIKVLRQHLRHQGWTSRRVASHFEIGEATAKRWLAGRGLTLDKLDALAGLCGLTLGELAREAEEPPAGLATELTLAQEKALSSDIFLAFLFTTILGGNAPDEVARDFNVPDGEMAASLLRLERLALIDRLPGGRVRPLIDRAIIWRKTPMRALFEEHMKAQFVNMDFSRENAVYTSEIMKLSQQGAAMLAELIDKHRREVQALAEQDRHVSHLARQWYGMLCAVRPLDMTRLRRG